MPFVPSPGETRRLRRAIEHARFSEGERIWWLVSFSALIALDLVLVFTGATWPGLLVAVVGFVVCYWRLRAPYLAPVYPDDRDLHGLGLASRTQRAFTALMLRHAFTGGNPMTPKVEHDRYTAFAARVERQEPAPEEPAGSSA
jgi:hypothetical protein